MPEVGVFEQLLESCKTMQVTQALMQKNIELLSERLARLEEVDSASEGVPQAVEQPESRNTDDASVDYGDNRTAPGALYQAARQALDTLIWLQETLDGANFKSDIILLDRATKMADGTYNPDRYTLPGEYEREAASADKAAHTDHPSRHYDRTCPACTGVVNESEGS